MSLANKWQWNRFSSTTLGAETMCCFAVVVMKMDLLCWEDDTFFKNYASCAVNQKGLWWSQHISVDSPLCIPPTVRAVCLFLCVLMGFLECCFTVHCPCFHVLQKRYWTPLSKRQCACRLIKCSRSVCGAVAVQLFRLLAFTDDACWQCLCFCSLWCTQPEQYLYVL